MTVTKLYIEDKSFNLLHFLIIFIKFEINLRKVNSN